IKAGDRIAQLILEKAVSPRIIKVDHLDKTSRGEHGFGSTGSQEIIKLEISAIAARSESELLTFPGILAGKAVTVLLDGGSRGNFISSRIWGKGRTPHGERTTIILADGSTHFAHEVQDVNLEVNEYSDQLNFYIAPISHDVILGKPWLDALNPAID